MDYRIIEGDCIEGMRRLEGQSVNCVVTSPPYYGLRDYGTGKWDGGIADCDHVRRRIADGMDGTTQNSCRQGRTPPADIKYTGVCEKCGATRVDGQIGLEASPDAFVAKLVEVFREVRRVLRDDGTLWLNLGDSYSSATSGNGGYSEKSTLSGFTSPDTKGRRANESGTRKRIHPGVKPKNLIGIPWRVAFALQADGWYLRQDIIWHKPNPMPESVRDRCTKAHEYIFLLSKSERYYFDSEAIKEPSAQGSDKWGKGGARKTRGLQGYTNASGAQRDNSGGYGTTGTRNRRSVWTVATKPYKGAHFATFPPDLIRPCILAGCPAGGTVLDPFGGSGTTAQVAIEEGRKAILCELNADYIALAHKRLEGLQLRIA